MTLLMIGAHSGHDQVVALLLKRGAATEPTDRSGYTALMHACRRNHTASARLLLEAGAEKDAVMEGTGDTCLTLACFRGHHEIVDLLVNAGASLDMAEEEQDATALILAARCGDVECVKRLLAAGAAIETARFDGMTALMLAARQKHSEVVHMLVEAGASVDSTALSGQAALRIACANKGAVSPAGPQDDQVMLVARHLIEAKADVNKRCPSGCTSLMAAATNGHVGCATLLLAAGADAGLRDNDGETALVYAIREGSATVARELLNAGAALDETCAEEYSGEGRRSLLMLASFHGHLNCTRALVEAKADVNATSAKGQTALMCACEHGHAKCAEELLTAGAHAELVNVAQGRSALMMAVCNKHVSAVRALLQFGVDPAVPPGNAPPTTPRMLTGFVASPDCLCTGAFSTVAAPHLAASRGKVFFEVQLGSVIYAQLGWVSTSVPHELLHAQRGDGVGDAVGSWAADGLRQLAWGTGAVGTKPHDTRYALRCVKGDNKFEVFTLPTASDEDSAPTLLGRLDECDITLNDSPVSRRHLEIRVSSEGLTVTDLGSTYGTKVNGRPVARGEVVQLKLGDCLSVTDEVDLLLVEPAESSHWPVQWSAGDVIGLAADLTHGTISCVTNGVSRAVFAGIPPGTSLYPAISVEGHCTVNLGHKPWKFGPPDASYRPTTVGDVNVELMPLSSSSVRVSLAAVQTPDE